MTTGRRLLVSCFGMLSICSQSVYSAPIDNKTKLMTQPKSTVGAGRPTASDIEKTLSSSNVNYENHVIAARFFEARGLITQAEEQYHLAISFKEASPASFKSLAQLLLQSQDQKEAEQVMLTAVKKFPQDYGVLLNAGFVLHNGHKFSQALEMYDRASVVKPNAPDIWIARSDVLIDMKQPGAALTSVEKALAMPNPTSLAYFEDAKALLALGRLDDALVPLSKNFAKNPFNFSSGLAYSALLQKLGKLELALDVRLCLLATTSGKSMDDLKLMVADLILKLPHEVVQASIKRAEEKIGNPKVQAIMHFALGDIYDRAHRPDDGMLQYKKGLLLNPQYARGYLRLGEDLEDSKSNFKQALSNYEKAYELNAKDNEVKARLEKLKIRIKTSK